MNNSSPIQRASVTFDAAVSKLTQTSKNARATLMSLSERFTGEVRGRLMSLSTPLKNDNRAEKALDKTCGQLEQFQAVATPSRAPYEAMLAVQKLKALPAPPQPKVAAIARRHSLPPETQAVTPTRTERAKSEPPGMQNLQQIADTPTNQRAPKLREFIQSNTFNTHIASLEKLLQNPTTSKQLQIDTKAYLAQTKEMMKAVGFGETIKDNLPTSVETVFRLMK